MFNPLPTSPRAAPILARLQRFAEPLLDARVRIVSPCAYCLGVILSLMDQYHEQLNGVFLALADPTRRAVLGRLGAGPASIGELAKPFDMALPSFMKHIRFLEQSGLIVTRKQGRVRNC